MADNYTSPESLLFSVLLPEEWSSEPNLTYLRQKFNTAGCTFRLALDQREPTLECHEIAEEAREKYLSHWQDILSGDDK